VTVIVILFTFVVGLCRAHDVTVDLS